VTNNWRAIRAFYRAAEADILAAGPSEFGVDPYLWDVESIIHFTPIEQWLWHDIRACAAVLYPQYPIGRVFVDFANPAAKVAIECDGAAWHDPATDAKRDATLKALGWTVYRFQGWECRTDYDPETGKPGIARVRMREICERHEISRNYAQRRPTSEREDLTHLIWRHLEREHAILSATRAAKAAV
jgi:hypothetical protein